MRIFIFPLILLLSSITTLVQAQHEKGYFELDDIKDFFTDSLSNVQGADSYKELEWSYTFEDNQQAKLQKLAQEFEKEGLKIVENKKYGEVYLLTCYEVKIYTPQLLLERVNKLISIAKKYHLYHNAPGYNIPGIGYGINQYN